MFEDDICRCWNSDLCPRKDQCERAKRGGPGIYTVSSFYEEDKECEYFMERRIDKYEKY